MEVFIRFSFRGKGCEMRLSSLITAAEAISNELS